jgi:hypothetical protein
VSGPEPGEWRPYRKLEDHACDESRSMGVCRCEELEPEHNVTILELAAFRLGRPLEGGCFTGEDLNRAGLPMLGGCAVCGATIAAYNAAPSKSGYLKCAEGCIDDDGFWTVDEANRFLFPDEYEWKGVVP